MVVDKHSKKIVKAFTSVLPDRLLNLYASVSVVEIRLTLKLLVSQWGNHVQASELVITDSWKKVYNKLYKVSSSLTLP
jgi:hypothetical protein